MAVLDIYARNFQHRLGLNGDYSPNVSRLKCVKFAMTVGNSHFSTAFAQTETALALAKYRAMAIRCVLDFTRQRVRRRDEYIRLESSEKINLSYWIGMTFAAIAADEVLGVPRLRHATRQNGLRKVNQQSKSLADLVGQSANGRWHVIEAKGRQTTPTAQQRRDWKMQAKTVGSINGRRASTRSYCVGIIDDPCYARLVDPPSEKPNSQNLIIDPEKFINDHYAPFRQFLAADTQRVTRGKRLFIIRLMAFDPINRDYIFVGLEDQILNSEGTGPFSVRVLEDESIYVGADGVAVVSSTNPCQV